MALPTWASGQNRLDNSLLDNLSYALNRAIYNVSGKYLALKLNHFAVFGYVNDDAPRTDGSIIQLAANGILFCSNGKWYGPAAGDIAYSTISGTVLDESSSPISGVSAEYLVNTSAYDSVLKTTTTDVSGNYDFGYVPTSFSPSFDPKLTYKKIGYFWDVQEVNILEGEPNDIDRTLRRGRLILEVRSKENNAHIFSAAVALKKDGATIASGTMPGTPGGSLTLSGIPVYLSDKNKNVKYDLEVTATNFDDYNDSVSFGYIYQDDGTDVEKTVLMESPPYDLTGIIQVNNGYTTKPVVGVKVTVGSKSTYTAADGSYTIPSLQNLSTQTVVLSGDLITTYSQSVTISGPTTFNYTVTAVEVAPFITTDSRTGNATMDQAAMSIGYEVVFTRPGIVTKVGSKSPTVWEQDENPGDQPPGGFKYKIRIYRPGIKIPVYSADLAIGTLNTVSYLTLPTPITVNRDDKLIFCIYVRGTNIYYPWVLSRMTAPRTLVSGQTDICQLLSYKESLGDHEPTQKNNSPRKTFIDFKFKVNA